MIDLDQLWTQGAALIPPRVELIEAGIAGALEVAGPMGQLTPHVSQGAGFAAIIVAFVGRLHPLGAVIASLVLATFTTFTTSITMIFYMSTSRKSGTCIT